MKAANRKENKLYFTKHECPGHSEDEEAGE